MAAVRAHAIPTTPTDLVIVISRLPAATYLELPPEAQKERRTEGREAPFGVVDIIQEAIETRM